MRRGGAALLLALVLLGALVWFVPWATKDRTAFTGTPTPTPFSVITSVRVDPGRQACVRPAALETATRQVVFDTAKFAPPGPPARLTVRGPGYRAAVRVPGGYGSGVPLAVAIPAPPRSLFAEVCLRNVGARPLAVQSSVENRILSRALTYVDGRRIRPRIALALTEGTPRSLASRPGELLAHAAAVRPWYAGRIALGLLGAVVLLGVPLGVAAALALVDPPQPEDAQQER